MSFTPSASRAALIVVLAAAAASAQEAPPVLTLQAVVERAQREGTAAKVARSVRDAARYRNDAFNQRLLPQLFVSGNAADLDHGINAVPQGDGTTKFIGQSDNQSTLSAGFSQAIPLTGGTITVGSSVSRYDRFGDANERLYQTSPFEVTLQQDLFRPRQIVWNRRVQDLSATVAERGYLEAREDVAGDAADAFFNLYAQEMSLRNAMTNAATNDTLYLINKGRFEVGKIGETELLKSELNLLKARASVEDSKLARDRAEAALRRIIAWPEGQPLAIATPDSIPTIAADPQKAVDEALRNSSATQQNNLDEVNAKRGLSQAHSNNRFTATIRASAGFNQTASVFGQAYQSPLGKQSLTVGVNVPVLQWGAGSAEVAGAEADIQRMQASNRQRHDQVAEDARFSALQLEQAQRNIVLAAKADTVAAKQFEVARNRYTTGRITATDLYNAQAEKDQALVSYVQALRSYWTAYYHLRRVTLFDFATNTRLVDDFVK
jgi:outer membrane protein TolC